MLKSPVFEISPLIDSFFLEHRGYRKISIKEWRAINKSYRILKSINSPIRWVFVKYQEKEHPVLLKKSGDHEIILLGPKSIRLMKAKLEKDLEYWKKKIMEILGDDVIEKSLQEILFPGILVKALPDEVLDLLEKSKGFPPGTVRKWSGKEFKKMDSGKWVRTYSEAESRGAKQAASNVKKKIANAKTMEELLEIVKENASRFKDKDGKMLPIVKEFLSAVRETVPGSKKKTQPEEEIKEGRGDDKEKRKERSDKGIERKRQFANGTFEMDVDEAENVIGAIKEKVNIDGVDFSYTEEDGDVIFYAEVDRKNVTDNIVINPYDLIEMENPEIEDLLSIENKDIKPEVPKTDYEEQEKKIEEKYKDIKSDQEPAVGEDAQAAIEEANPTNRIEKTLEVSGTEKEYKTDEEVMSMEGVKYFKPKDIDFEHTFHTSEGKIKGILKGKDYTDIDQREILLVPYKKIKESGDKWNEIRPEWIPEVDYDMFSHNKNTLIFDKIGDDKYIVPIKQSYKQHGTKRRYRYPGQTEFKEEKYDSLKQEYAILTLNQVAATQDFYRKISKAQIDARYDKMNAEFIESGLRTIRKKTRIQVMSDNKMLYDTSYLIKENRGISGNISLWDSYKENQSALKQKTIDMDLMREEVDNSFSKGRETSYGDSNTSDDLVDKYGVKIKRQDGSEITPEDSKYLSNAMLSIQKTFGSRKSMNENFGLKLSFAKGSAMHASKAVGLFVPTQRAIGISDGKGLKKKDPITGETRTVDYGDENFGGFVLSHEYAHMMDFYLGGGNGQWYSSDKEGSISNRIASEFRKNMNQESKSNYINRTCECFARALEQYHAIESTGEDAKSFFGKYVNEPQYVNKEKYDTIIKPLVEKFFQENDEFLKSIETIW